MALPLRNSDCLSKNFNPERSLLRDGFASATSVSGPKHPLEDSEKTYQPRMDEMNYSMLRSTQGIHAPLKLMMEKNFATKVGRLPFLPSSNLMLEVLEGRDESIGFEDLYNDPSEAEAMGPPHMVVERSLGIL